MDPNQQYPGSPQGNPYDFILNPTQPPKRKLVKDAFLIKIVVILVSVFLVMVVAAILLNVYGPKQIGAGELTSLAQTQTELARISQQAGTQARQQTTRNLAATVQYTMLTQQKQTLSLLKKRGKDINDKELALKQNATTDQQLKAAKTTSTFDKTYTTIVETELKTYAEHLRSLSANQSARKADRDQINDYYRQVQDLLGQVPYTQDSIESGTDTVQPTTP